MSKPKRITRKRIMNAPRLKGKGSLRYVIRDFDDFEDPDNVYRFLSNFYEPDVPYTTPLFPSVDFATTEHLYAACKVDHVGQDPLDSIHEWEAIALAPTPGEAKRLGRQCTMRPDWEEIKFAVMRHCLQIKFAEGREEAEWLLATGNAYLIEGTYWSDTVWGVDMKQRDQPGANWLGMMLMARRAELVSLEAMWHAKDLYLGLDNIQHAIDPLYGIDL
jgi:ribA/ribD-fused uncharacterized protein